MLKHDGTFVLLRFLSKIGSGSQGTVYKAAIDGIEYAVKSVSLRFSEGKYNRTAFNAESVIARNIRNVKNADNSNSQHICKFFGIIERKPGDEKHYVANSEVAEAAVFVGRKSTRLRWHNGNIMRMTVRS